MGLNCIDALSLVNKPHLSYCVQGVHTLHAAAWKLCESGVRTLLLLLHHFSHSVYQIIVLAPEGQDTVLEALLCMRGSAHVLKAWDRGSKFIAYSGQ